MLNFIKNAALKRIVQSAVRHGLTSLSVFLVSKGYGTEADWSSVALDLSPLIVALVWAVIEKQADKRSMAVSAKALEIAVAAPSGALTPADAKAMAKVDLAH